MWTPALLFVLAACTAPATDDPTVPHSADAPLTWTGVRACGSLRLFAESSTGEGVAVALHGDLVGAVLAKTPLTVDEDFAGPARGVVQVGIEAGDVCGSVEEFPPGPGPWWDIAAGTVHAVFTPAAGLGGDDTSWAWDGTEVGTVQLELRALELTPMDGAPPADAPDLDAELVVTVPDLPA
jgi:hypothetical protein